MQPNDNTGMLLLKRPTGPGTTVNLNYPQHQAERMRSLVADLKRWGYPASLALIAKRSMDTYLDSLEVARQGDPERFAGEMQALRQMLTTVPMPGSKSKTLTPSD